MSLNVIIKSEGSNWFGPFYFAFARGRVVYSDENPEGPARSGKALVKEQRILFHLKVWTVLFHFDIRS